MFTFGGSQTQPESENTPSKGRRSFTLRSLHSGMMLKAIGSDPDFSPESLEVDGKPVTNVTMVGKLLEITSELSSVKLRILDDLGEFDIRIWKRDGENPTEDLKEGKYVRVYGALKNEKGKPILVAFAAKSIKEYNEITHHSLAVIRQHLHFTKGPLDARLSQENMMETTQRSSMFGTPTPKALGDTHLSPMSIVGTPNIGSNSTELLENMKMIFKEDQSEAGLHIDEIFEKIGGGHGKEEVMKALAWLVNEGNIYTTTTEKHYQWCG